MIPKYVLGNKIEVCILRTTWNNSLQIINQNNSAICNINFISYKRNTKSVNVFQNKKPTWYFKDMKENTFWWFFSIWNWALAFITSTREREAGGSL